MIHESIAPDNNARVLINLNQVAHITVRPNQEHIILQFASNSLRLNCGSPQAAQDEYTSIKHRMQGQPPPADEHRRAQVPTPELHSVGSKRGVVFDIHRDGMTDISDPVRRMLGVSKHAIVSPTVIPVSRDANPNPKVVKATTQSRQDESDRQAIERGEDEGMIIHIGSTSREASP